MPVTFNVRHLEEKALSLQGELATSELDLATADELVHLPEFLSYDLEVEKIDNGILVQGRLRVTLQCECARCLKPYRHELLLEPWVSHLALEGDEKAAVINDCIDLTPYIREDILLAFPQHPLCEPECKGLAIPGNGPRNAGREPESASAIWAELNKLRLK